MSRPKVSIAIAAFNPGCFLLPAIRSLLTETQIAIEVIVINDGGNDGATDEAERVIIDPRLRFLHQENMGKSAALNHALVDARGKFFCIMDADDLSHPDRIARLVREMEHHPGIGGVMSGYNLIYRGRKVAPIEVAKDEAACKADIEAFRMPSHDPTLMVRTSIARQLSFAQDLKVGQGYDFILRLGENYPMRTVANSLYGYRIHNASITRSDPERREQMVWEVLRRACERRGVDFEGWKASKLLRQRSKGWRRDNGLAAHFIRSVQDQRRRGRLVGAVTTGLQCARLRPLDPQYLKALVFGVSPDWLRSKYPSYVR